MRRRKVKYKAALWKDRTAKYWDKLAAIEKEYYKKLSRLEALMARETSIEDREFFYCDNAIVGIVGIGNATRTMELIHRP